MNESELKQIIVEELAKVAPGSNPGVVDGNDDLREALDIDSFDALNFFIAISERLHVDIPEKDMGRLGTSNQIIKYLLTSKVKA